MLYCMMSVIHTHSIPMKNVYVQISTYLTHEGPERHFSCLARHNFTNARHNFTNARHNFTDARKII